MEFEVIRIDDNQLKERELSLREFAIEDVIIENDEQYLNLCMLLKKVKGKKNEIIEFFAGPKKEAYENHKAISRLENEMLQRLSEFESLAKKRIGEYILAKEEARNLDNPITTPKVKGISSQDAYKWEVEDINKVPREYLMINEKLINEIIKKTNGSFVIPGIVVRKEKVVSVRGE